MRYVSMSGASGRGKVVVITGALGALGKMVAEEALSRGARVAGIDHAASQLAATAKRVEFGRVDLTDAAQAKKAVDAAAAHFGAIDALINIAGGFTFETIADGDPKVWQRMYALNVETALNASRAAIPYLLNSRAARIVNIGAMGALQAGSGMGPYGASKAGVHKLTESLAAELKGEITVNAVLPLIIDTAANRASMPKADPTKWVAPKELADVILFLASDAASAVTGALLPVNGQSLKYAYAATSSEAPPETECYACPLARWLRIRGLRRRNRCINFEMAINGGTPKRFGIAGATLLARADFLIEQLVVYNLVLPRRMSPEMVFSEVVDLLRDVCCRGKTGGGHNQAWNICVD